MASSALKMLSTLNIDVKFLVVTAVFALLGVAIVKLIGLFQRRWFLEKAYSKFPCYDRHWLLGNLDLVSPVHPGTI